MNPGLVLQSPSAPRHLFLLFHGVGATPHDLAPLGQVLAAAFPDAAVVSVPAPDRSDLGQGLQWFSVVGVTEQGRPARVAATLPRFLATVQAWQQHTETTPANTTLVGFSQGAIMVLAASEAAEPPAARVAALSGRYPAVPSTAPKGVRFHFLHGATDAVIPAAHAQAAAQALQAAGGGVTLDVLPQLGHGIDRAVADRLLERLGAASRS